MKNTRDLTNIDSGYFSNDLAKHEVNPYTGETIDYLTKQPTKREALINNQIAGKTTILPNSNNRAITIATDNEIFLQSYDTLILSLNTNTGEVKKLWDGFSTTTLKHINEFLSAFGLSFNKKSWLAFKGCTLAQ